MTSISRCYSQTISYPTKLRYLNDEKIIVGLLALFVSSTVSYISSNLKNSNDEDDTKEVVVKNIRYFITMLTVLKHLFRCKL